MKLDKEIFYKKMSEDGSFDFLEKCTKELDAKYTEILHKINKKNDGRAMLFAFCILNSFYEASFEMLISNFPPENQEQARLEFGLLINAVKSRNTQSEIKTLN